MFAMDWAVQPAVESLFGGMLGLWVAVRPGDVAGTDEVATLP